MTVFSKYLLRTKVSGPVVEQDLEDRELIFGNVEKSIFVKDYDGTILCQFLRNSDSETTDLNTWSALRIQQLLAGSSIENNLVLGEEPSGTLDGENKIFNLTNEYLPGLTEIFLNGLRVKVGQDHDYVESGPDEITMNYPPEEEDNLLVNYVKAS